GHRVSHVSGPARLWGLIPFTRLVGLRWQARDRPPGPSLSRRNEPSAVVSVRLVPQVAGHQRPIPARPAIPVPGHGRVRDRPVIAGWCQDTRRAAPSAHPQNYVDGYVFGRGRCRHGVGTMVARSTRSGTKTAEEREAEEVIEIRADLPQEPNSFIGRERE